ncbi:MAG: hypothetical protein ACI4SV_02805 [Duodenibacillus sp.]
MAFDIQPLHIGIVVVVILAAIAWYAMRRNRAADSQAESLAERIKSTQKQAHDERGSQNVSLPNAIAAEEPEAPVLKPEDQLAVEPMAPQPAVQPEPVREVAPEPAPEPTPEPAPVAEVGHATSGVDDAVEASVLLTPLHRMFDAVKLQEALELFEAKKSIGVLAMDFYDEDSALWFRDPKSVRVCTQINLSMLLAHRGYEVDEYAASSFIGLANQMMSVLDAEGLLPDSSTMVRNAKRVTDIIQAFDQQLTMKIVSARDLDRDRLAEVAGECGFAAHEGVFEKYVPGSREPAIVLRPSATLGNEAELTLDLPLMAASNDPLAAYFSIANDICCKIDAVTTDGSGNPVGVAVASYIARQLRDLHTSMAAHGVTAGSRRALMIFSRG